MNYILIHIKNILNSYKGKQPLSKFLKNYFKQNPILGSRDRRVLSEMSYCYYRCAKSIKSNISIEEKIFSSLVICNSKIPAIIKLLPEPFKSIHNLNFNKKISALKQIGVTYSIENLNDVNIRFSNGILKKEWLMSLLKKPFVFVVIQNEYINVALAKIKELLIPYKSIEPNIIQVQNGTAIENVLEPYWYRIQDYSSQATKEYFIDNKEKNWLDCCSGSGGKSLLLLDKIPQAKLTVCDIRSSILDNLKKRFKLYNLQIPQTINTSFEQRESIEKYQLQQQFDHVIADVPCSGSGTWARTPENFYFFEHSSLNLKYTNRQRKIALNATDSLKNGAYLYYITCSVFAEENEDVVNYLLQHNTDLKLISQQLINGISLGADSMFIAVLQKNKV